MASVQAIRTVIARMNRERGTTMFLTAHTIEEAGDLCHRVAIIHQGRLAAVDTPQALRGTIEARRSVEVRFAVPDVAPGDMGPAAKAAGTLPLGDGLSVSSAEPGRIAQEIAARSAARGTGIISLNTLAPSLEDVFLYITGTRAREPEPRDAA